MELISTKICLASDIGIHNNMFGGTLMASIDEAAAAYAAQICKTPRMVTVLVESLIFKKPIKIGNIIKIYGKPVKIGRTSITLYIEVRKMNVYTSDYEIVTHTNIKFVRIGDNDNAIPLDTEIKTLYEFEE